MEDASRYYGLSTSIQVLNGKSSERVSCNVIWGFIRNVNIQQFVSIGFMLSLTTLFQFLHSNSNNNNNKIS